MARKLGRPTDQKNALLKGQVSDLFWYGKIETTLSRGKDVARLAEKYLTVAIKAYDDQVEVTKKVKNSKDVIEEVKVINDGPKKLNARRYLMARLYDPQERKLQGESRTEYKLRTRDVKHPLVEKIFKEYAPKYAARNQETNQAGGYTRILKLGARRGDDAETVIVELL